MFQALSLQLHDYQRKALNRSRRVSQSAQGIEVVYNDQKCISFCSNDYLNIANHPDVIRAFQLGATKFGLGSGASQLVCGHNIAHQALEEQFADFLGYEKCLLFSNGYMANLGVITTLMRQGGYLLQDKYNHASLLDAGIASQGHLNRYQHKNLNSLEKLLIKYREQFKLIVSDGIFSIDGDLAPLPQLVKLSQEYQTPLMIDDAHGIGVLGQQGRGCIEHFQLSATDIPILVCPLGKAFGSYGAIVASNATVIDSLIHFARSYVYTTATPPAIAYASATSLKIVRDESWRREKLKHLIKFYQQQAKLRNLPIVTSPSPIQSLIVGDAADALAIQQKMLTHGFLIYAMRPPSIPTKTSCIRITLNALHTEQQIQKLLDKLTTIMNKQAVSKEVAHD